MKPLTRKVNNISE